MPELKLLSWFVTGAVAEYFQRTSMNLDSKEFENYCHRATDTVWRYLRGTKTLDGTCSDLECSVAHLAEKLFKPKA